MRDEAIDEALWNRARELAAGDDGLHIVGLGTLRRGALSAEPDAGGGRYDAPKLVVAVADALGVPDDRVRSRFRSEVAQAVASAEARPAPLGPLGLIERSAEGLRFWPAHRSGAAPAGAVDDALAAWRAPADTLDDRVAALVESLDRITGALPPADLRRLLDELGYDLDPADWRRVGDRIVAALPF